MQCLLLLPDFHSQKPCVYWAPLHQKTVPQFPLHFFSQLSSSSGTKQKPSANLEDNQHLFDTIRTNKKPRKIKLTLQKPKFISWTVLFTAKTKNEWLGRACSKTALIFFKRVIQQKLIGSLWWKLMMNFDHIYLKDSIKQSSNKSCESSPISII